MKTQLVVLLVEDDHNVLDSLRLFVESLSNVEIWTAFDFSQATIVLMAQPRIDLLLCDVVLRGNLTGIDVACAAVDVHPQVAVVMFSAEEKINVLGLTDRYSFVRKPFGVQTITQQIDEAFARLHLE